MEFRTVVELPEKMPPICHAGKILLMGSCFAENMGRLLSENKFDIDVNPFGILYNPLSLQRALEEIMEGKVYEPGELFLYRSCWHSPMHHSSFSDLNKDTVLTKINARLQNAYCSFSKLDWIILTFGTAYVYERKEDGMVIGNCHQLPEKTFVRRMITPEEIMAVYRPLLQKIKKTCSAVKVLLTVSPIRHIRDGLHGNQVSKSGPLLATDQLPQESPAFVFYFPSYEIILDELRDYRFYADDMVHPSDLAVRYLWKCFSETFFTAETRQIISEVESISRDILHRPFRPNSDAYQRFLEQIVLKIERLNRKYPYLDFQKEKELCHIRLNS